MFRGEIDFEAVFAGVAGARDEAINATDLAKRKMIVADGVELRWRELLQDFSGARALNRELRVARSGVFNRRVELIVGDDVLIVVVLISGVDAEQIVRVRDFVDQEVVHKSAARGHQAGVMGLADIQFCGIVAADPLDQLQRAGTADFEFASG